jgi:hypothetical protein
MLFFACLAIPHGGTIMDTDNAEGFVVFVRTEGNYEQEPQAVERPLFVCSSYEEARDLQRAAHDSHHEYIIRYLGETGGGD